MQQTQAPAQTAEPTSGSAGAPVDSTTGSAGGQEKLSFMDQVRGHAKKTAGQGGCGEVFCECDEPAAKHAASSTVFNKPHEVEQGKAKLAGEPIPDGPSSA